MRGRTRTEDERAMEPEDIRGLVSSVLTSIEARRNPPNSSTAAELREATDDRRVVLEVTVFSCEGSTLERRPLAVSVCVFFAEGLLFSLDSLFITSTSALPIDAKLSDCRMLERVTGLRAAAPVLVAEAMR